MDRVAKGLADGPCSQGPCRGENPVKENGREWNEEGFFELARVRYEDHEEGARGLGKALC
jgi:hypothetical protein